MAAEQTNQTTLDDARNDASSAERSYAMTKWLDESRGEGPWNAVEASIDGPVFQTRETIDGNQDATANASETDDQAQVQAESTQQG